MEPVHIEIDDKSGFCFGVVRAITEAERALGEGGTVYSLGDIVHNRIEVQRLEELGLWTVTHADMPRLAGCRLFIRAHGEPPTTYDGWVSGSSTPPVPWSHGCNGGASRRTRRCAPSADRW